MAGSILLDAMLDRTHGLRMKFTGIARNSSSGVKTMSDSIQVLKGRRQRGQTACRHPRDSSKGDGEVYISCVKTMDTMNRNYNSSPNLEASPRR